MTTLLSKRLVGGVTLLGLLGVVAYLATAVPGRSQVPDATVTIGSTDALTNSQATVDLIVTPQPGVKVGALLVVVTYDDALLSAISCDAVGIYTLGDCNRVFGLDQVAFAWVSNTGELSGLLGTITFATFASAGTAGLSVAVTTCADDVGVTLACITTGGAITLTPSPTATPQPTPTPSPAPTQPPRKWGDVNCSGTVDAVDALAILRNVAGLQVTQATPCPTIGAAYP